MNWMVGNMKWIMLVSGVLTSTIALVLSEGARYLSQQAAVAVAIDSVMVLLFASYALFSPRRNQ